MIWALLWMTILITVFIGSYVLNKRTPKPEGCESLDACQGCYNVACSHYEEEQ